LAHSVVTPDCYQGRVRGTHRRYAGYHELAYLHPDRFQPDPQRLRGFGIDPGERYSIVRFVSWEASHDRHEQGLTVAKKLELVERMGRHGRVLISSEKPVAPELAEFEVKGPVEDIHHLLAYAQMIVGESATMSSEAAVLGVPAVMIATTGRGYTDDEERRYGLVRYFKEDQYERALAMVEEIVADSPRELGALARERLLHDKIDVTQWMVDYFESTFAEAR
jgi:predicted glycosyltransferase